LRYSTKAVFGSLVELETCRKMVCGWSKIEKSSESLG
jgi:hypothetical protein